MKNKRNTRLFTKLSPRIANSVPTPAISADTRLKLKRLRRALSQIEVAENANRESPRLARMMLLLDKITLLV